MLRTKAPHSTYYYKPLEGESYRNLEIMRKIDHQYTEHPAMGTRQMVDYLKAEGFMVGRKLVRRLMALHSGLGALQYA